MVTGIVAYWLDRCGSGMRVMMGGIVAYWFWRIFRIARNDVVISIEAD
jgi:hypothetical protein